MALQAHALAPSTDRVDGEGRRIGGDADTDPAGICADVVDAVRHHLAEFFVGEIMHIDAGRIAFRPVVAASVAVIANQLFLLGVDRDDGLPGRLRGQHAGANMLELRIAIGVVGALVRLAIDLPRVSPALFPAT